MFATHCITCAEATARAEAAEARNVKLIDDMAIAVAAMSLASGRLEVIGTGKYDRQIVSALNASRDLLRQALGGEHD